VKFTGGNPASPQYWVRKMLGAAEESSSGIEVDEDSALRHSPVWAAVNIIAGTIGALPLKVYRRLEKGKEVQPSHPIYRLLHDQPNPFMDALTFRELLQGHVLTWGNGYAEIQWTGRGDPIALWPLLPDRTEPQLNEKKELIYRVLDRQTQRQAILPASSVLHIRGLGFDGLKGYSPIRYHIEAIGLGVATKRYGARFFGNGAQPGGILEHPGIVAEDKRKRMKESWEEAHQGLEQSHRIAILEDGMKWHQVGVSPEDAQAIETQKFSVSDIARIYQVPLHMLAELDRATFNNIEHQKIEFLAMTLYRWLRKWEIECGLKLFSETERTEYFAEFVTDALLRGDTPSRYAAYQSAVFAGWMTRNEVRAKENLNPLDGLDEPLEPENTRPAGEYPTNAPKPKRLPGTTLPAATDDEDQAPDERAMTKIAEGFSLVLADTLQRMSRKHFNDARRGNQRNPGTQWPQWLDAYCREQEPTFRGALIPAIQGAAEALWAAWGYRREPPESVQRTVAEFTATTVKHYWRDFHASAEEWKDEVGDGRQRADAITEALVCLMRTQSKEYDHALSEPSCSPVA
jgi:HK97 family phage portal protein